MTVAVVICTLNRADRLRRVLEDLSASVLPAGCAGEVLVVDNGGSDGTADLVRSQGRCGPLGLRYLREERRGQSHARNRGIAEAGAEWLLFTDDDVRVPPDWVAGLPRAADAMGADAVGGRVLPLWPSRLPRWVATSGRFLESIVFLSYDLGGESRLLRPDDALPVGCSMAFRASLFARHGGFRADLGHQGTRILGGEDTEMFRRLREAGVPVGYAAGAVLRHPVEPERLALSFLLRRRFWEGYGAVVSGQEPVGREALGVPLWVLRRLGRGAASLAGAAARRDWPAAAHYLGGCSGKLGMIWGARALRRGLAAGPRPDEASAPETAPRPRPPVLESPARHD